MVVEDESKTAQELPSYGTKMFKVVYLPFFSAWLNLACGVKYKSSVNHIDMIDKKTAVQVDN